MATFVHPTSFWFLEMNKWEARLIDFGASAEIGSDEEPLGHLMTSSISMMMGQPLRPEDDLESLVYTLFWMKNGSLPWEGLEESEVLSKKRSFLRTLSQVDFFPTKQLQRVQEAVEQTNDLPPPLFFPRSWLQIPAATSAN